MTVRKQLEAGADEASEERAPSNEQVESVWARTAFRRFSVDIHVPDWHPDLLGHFDAAEYVGHIASAGHQSLLQMANSHVGLCLWNTAVGQKHANMGHHDFFGEVVAECRRQGVHPLAYFSLMHDNWAYQTHPDWRIVRAGGNGGLQEGRYGVVCPNSPYREYVLACVRELAGGYDIDGMFFDMTFWPGLCYCTHCTERFLREQQSELPRMVDWHDPTWRAFQQARQRWLLEFAQDITATVHAVRPMLTVNHQFSTIFHNWTLGVPLDLAQACDYVGGDFYGGATQHSLACKVYHGLTRQRPFEFHTSRTRDYRDHVTVKSLQEIRTESFVATLHGAALMLVDYINADGTLNPRVYEQLAKVNAERALYEPFLGGDLLADVAIYFDKESMYNPDEDRVRVDQWHALDRCPHRDAVVGAARILQEAHIPYGVVTNSNIMDLHRYRAVWLPGVLEMTAAQAAEFRAFVERGGVLYASGTSSLDPLAGPEPRLLLEDVFGVRYRGRLGSRITYLTPRDKDLAQAVWPQDHVSFEGPMVHVEAAPDCEVLATITLPFVDPSEGRVIGSRFAAIHSNPPAIVPGDAPAVVCRRYGRGSVVWVAASLESRPEMAASGLAVHLLRRVLPGPYQFEADTHPGVEITLFGQPERRRLLVGVLNTQSSSPEVPGGASVRVQLPSAAAGVARVLRLPGQTPVAHAVQGPYVGFQVEPLDTFALFSVEYR